MDKTNVAVMIYPGVEVIDMNGPVDVFVKAGRFKSDRYHVFTVSVIKNKGLKTFHVCQLSNGIARRIGYN